MKYFKLISLLGLGMIATIFLVFYLGMVGVILSFAVGLIVGWIIPVILKK